MVALDAAQMKRAGPEGSLLRNVGHTPLIRLHSLESQLAGDVKLYAKAEWFNPSGSVKIRPALGMIQGARSDGSLKDDQTILDATSGNTGIAYATIAGVLDYNLDLCLPENATEERKTILSALGANLTFTEAELEMDGAIEKARQKKDEQPDRYFYPDQYSNPYNWQSHFVTTGPEIWQQTGNEITHFVAGLGTTGTFMGTARYLQKQKPDITSVSVQPSTALHGLEGWKHLESAHVPDIYDPDVADDSLRVETEEAYKMMTDLAQNEGLFVSPSSGAAALAGFRVARSLSRGTVVTILPDGGDKYMEVWSRELMDA